MIACAFRTPIVSRVPKQLDKYLHTIELILITYETENILYTCPQYVERSLGAVGKNTQVTSYPSRKGSDGSMYRIYRRLTELFPDGYLDMKVQVASRSCLA